MFICKINIITASFLTLPPDQNLSHKGLQIEFFLITFSQIIKITLKNSMKGPKKTNNRIDAINILSVSKVWYSSKTKKKQLPAWILDISGAASDIYANKMT